MFESYKLEHGQTVKSSLTRNNFLKLENSQTRTNKDNLIADSSNAYDMRHIISHSSMIMVNKKLVVRDRTYLRFNYLCTSKSVLKLMLPAAILHENGLNRHVTTQEQIKYKIFLKK